VGVLTADRDHGSDPAREIAVRGIRTAQPEIAVRRQKVRSDCTSCRQTAISAGY